MTWLPITDDATSSARFASCAELNPDLQIRNLIDDPRVQAALRAAFVPAATPTPADASQQQRGLTDRARRRSQRTGHTQPGALAAA